MLQGRRVARAALVVAPVFLLAQAVQPYPGLPSDGATTVYATAWCQGEGGASVVFDYVAGPTPYGSPEAALRAFRTPAPRHDDVRRLASRPDVVLVAAFTPDGQVSDLFTVGAFPDQTWAVQGYRQCMTDLPRAEVVTYDGPEPPVGESSEAR